MLEGKQFSKEEWWDVCLRVKPDLTWEEYEALWEDYIQRRDDGMLNPC